MHVLTTRWRKTTWLWMLNRYTLLFLAIGSSIPPTVSVSTFLGLSHPSRPYTHFPFARSLFLFFLWNGFIVAFQFFLSFTFSHYRHIKHRYRLNHLIDFCLIYLIFISLLASHHISRILSTRCCKKHTKV